MLSPSQDEADRPQRVKLSAEDFAQIDPADAVAWAPPNQLWLPEVE